MAEWPVHASIEGPIVMIGFGSIGRGTLPLIERHFDFDKSRFVVSDPDVPDRFDPAVFAPAVGGGPYVPLFPHTLL